jgi:hypothetical protein
VGRRALCSTAGQSGCDGRSAGVRGPRFHLAYGMPADSRIPRPPHKVSTSGDGHSAGPYTALCSESVRFSPK